MKLGPRRAHLQWLEDQHINADVWRALLFDVPLLRWTREADDAAYERFINTFGEPRVKAAIWCVAGELLHWRHDKGHRTEQRPRIRRALVLLRRSWMAHCAGREDLSKERFSAAQAEHTRAGLALLVGKGSDALMEEIDRRTRGRRAHRGKPERLTEEINKAIAANPGKSNYQIAALVGCSEPTVRRRRDKPKKS